MAQAPVDNREIKSQQGSLVPSQWTANNAIIVGLAVGLLHQYRYVGTLHPSLFSFVLYFLQWALTHHCHRRLLKCLSGRVHCSPPRLWLTAQQRASRSLVVFPMWLCTVHAIATCCLLMASLFPPRWSATSDSSALNNPVLQQCCRCAEQRCSSC